MVSAAAFVFATQMLNFPIAAGTSGHMTGAVLAVVLLGPGAAVIVMTAVLVLQCFMFADGGVTALGANVLNMAIIAPAVGYVVYAGLAVVRATGSGRCCSRQVSQRGARRWRLRSPARWNWLPQARSCCAARSWPWAACTWWWAWWRRRSR